MKKIFLLIIIFFITVSYSQEKYFIYFKDKGIKETETLSKTNPLYKQAENLLTIRAIERRKKTMGDDYITYGDLPISQQYVNKIEELGIKILRKLTWFNSVSAYLTEEQKNKVSALPFVKKVETVKRISFKRDEYPDTDQLKKNSGDNTELNYGQSFGQLDLSDIPQVHSIGITGQGVIIGLLDSGFDWMQHEALQSRNVIAEYDFIFNDTITANQPGDDPGQDGHGTGVFSIAGGFKDSVLIGAAYNSTFVLAKTEDIRSESHIEEDNYAAALIWMENFGVDITSSSLGYSEFDDTTYSYTYNDMNGSTTIVTIACEEAFNRGVVTITSAGNEGDDIWHFITAPADGFNTIAVGAVNSDNIVTGFSGRGPTVDGRIKPDVVTQGSGCFAASSFGTNSYNSNFGGTSAAAPIACGSAALLLSAHLHLNNTQVRRILLETADNSKTPNNDRGYGLISVEKAVSFPNLERLNSGPIVVFKLHKIFLTNGINPSTVKINYSSGSSFTEEPLIYDGNLKYNFLFPSFALDQNVKFHFTFQDSSGKFFREPSNNDNYSFDYGQLNILMNLKNSSLPKEYQLSQNYPNPFNPSTIIKYDLTSGGFITLKVFDILGREVAVLVNEEKPAGSYNIEFDASSLSSGIYVYQLIAEGFVSAKKMMLVK
jgi:hypothetical protein